MVKEYPILFNTEMVKAILDGRKTQTRRIIKPQPTASGGFLANVIPLWLYPQEYINKYCHYRIGDRLWVRETFDTALNIIKREDDVFYKADYNDTMPKGIYNWKPSIFMPRWASRINLEITDIRVQRIQDITEEDAIAEGITKIQCDCGDCIDSTIIGAYQDLWNSINSKQGYGWDINPCVWIINFIRISRE